MLPREQEAEGALSFLPPVAPAASQSGGDLGSGPGWVVSRMGK